MSAVATVGSLTVDVVADGEPRPGGTAWYAAEAFRALGVPAVVVTRAAEDEQWVVDALAARGGPEVVCAPATTTAAFSFSYDTAGHRTMRVDAVGDPWTRGDVEDWVAAALGDARWVQVGALLRSDFDADALAALGQDGRRLLVDAQGLVRVPEVGPLRRDAAVDRACFAHVAALKLGENEARILTGGTSATDVRSIGVDEVLVTLGEAGALVVTPRGAERVPPASVSDTDDPTGAGDIFGAAYIVARAEDAEPVEAARHASELVSAVLAER